eukprot:UN34394
MSTDKDDGIAKHFPNLIPALQNCMSDKDLKLKQETLDLIQKIILSHQANVLQKYSSDFADILIGAMKETANSLIVLSMTTARIFYNRLFGAKKIILRKFNPWFKNFINLFVNNLKFRILTQVQKQPPSEQVRWRYQNLVQC